MKSILVCRLSALGDIVLTLPVLDALREAYPHARIDYLARDPLGRVLANDSRVDRLHAWEGSGRPAPASVASEVWDLIVDLSGTGRSRRILARVRASRRLRLRKESVARWAFVNLRAVGGGSVRLSTAVDRMFSSLAPLGIRREGRVPRFKLPAPPEDGPLLIAPGAGRSTKEWPVESFAEAARRVTETGRRILAVGSAEERPLLEKVAAAVPDGAAEIVAGADPADLPGIAARAPVALVNDSAWLHLAEAAGARVVALFGPTHPRLGFAPLGPESRALHVGLDCSPCDLHGPERCPRGHHDCLRTLTVDRVVSEVFQRFPEAVQ